MTMAALSAERQIASPEPGGVPIRNLWHMLLYAWNLAVVSNRWFVNVEESPHLMHYLRAS